MTIEDARERVAKGAALLDQERPGWAKAIDVGRLNIEACSRCVLGQLFGHYESGVTAIPLLGPTGGRSGRGFTLRGVEASDEEADVNWRLLQDAWIELIADRLLASPVETPIASQALIAVED